MDAEILARVVRTYTGSDGEATKALYDELTALGPVGLVATNLFRAHKSSIRAKVYRRGSSRRAAYDRKDWSIQNLAIALSEHADAFGFPWGWGIDDKQPFHKLVLYVDLESATMLHRLITETPIPGGDGLHRIWIPRAHAAGVRRRQRQIRDAVAAGQSKAKTALQFQVTNRWVRTVCNREPEEDERQGKLF